LAQRSIEAVIPPKSNRLLQRDYDRHVYKDRSLVERFFNRLKQFRRIALAMKNLPETSLPCSIWSAQLFGWRKRQQTLALANTP
jgi:transposase